MDRPGLAGDASETNQVDVSIVIPCYRDEEGVDAIFDRMQPIMEQIGRCELVLVDDGSPDRTAQRIEERAAGYAHEVVLIRMARNFGQHPAVFAGLAHARGNRVITMDSDLQYPPEEISALLGALGEGSRVASGIRAERRDPLVRRLITRMLSWWLSRRTGTRLKDFGSMFRAYDRSVVEQLLQFTEQRRFVPGLVAWLGVPITEIPVRHEPRREQGSRYRLGPLMDMFLDLITGYSLSPLRLVSFAALAGSLLGFAATAAFAVYRVVEGGGISGTVSAFALVFLLLGIQLAVVALLSEYVGRIYNESTGRPYYIVGQVSTNR